MRDFVVIGLVTWAGALAACGSSLRLEEQSVAYFEHCHAAERDPSASENDRAACWEAWLAHWSELGNRGRVAHAEARLASLRSPAPDAALASAGGEAAGAGDATPSSASRGAADAEASPADEATPRRSDHSRLTGSGACDAVCLPSFDRCLSSCDPATIKNCRAACESERRFCQLACP